MSRGGRSKRKSRDEDEGIDHLEREWILQREKSKRPKSLDVHEAEQSPIEQSVDKSGESNTQSKQLSPEEEKINRLRLKKQQQKQRRKEKKAMAAATAKELEISKRKASEANLKQQQEELEKKKKLKESGQLQQHEFKFLRMGVKYNDVIVGKGIPVQHRKKVRVSYTLRSKSHTTGKILDSSRNFGFRLGKGEVIKGWDIGLEGMKVGGIRRLVVPAIAGYGNKKDVGAGRGADLYFEIELLHVAP